MRMQDLKKTLKGMLGDDSRPIVVFSSMWPFFYEINLPKEEILRIVLDLLIEITGGNRSLLMPTFTRGYQDGRFYLDSEPSLTGILTERFRQLDNAKRSLSAFFSFSSVGCDTDAFVKLKPEYAWGEGSVYHWMEEKNVHFLMLGTHPTACSYLHRMEWLSRDKINYRYVKRFEGEIIDKNRRIHMVENLYVRTLNPEVENDFTIILDALKKGGMKIECLDGISIAEMGAQAMKKVYLSILQDDPFITVKNRASFEEV